MSLLIGQITSEGGSDLEFEGAPVLLLRQMEIIAKATTNRLGEFHLEFSGTTTGLALAVGLKDGGTVINLDMPRTQS